MVLMDPLSASATSSGLLISRAQEDGTHSAGQMMRELRSGRLVKLRRGVFLNAQVWLDSYPSDRFRWVAAATAAQLRNPRFCRETALMLHGVPLLAQPSAVQVRANSRSAARRAQQPSMTGKFPAAQFLSAARKNLSGFRGEWDRNVFTGFGTHFVSPTGIPADEPPDECMLLGGLIAVEPLTLVLVDTVPRMPFDRGVVALDAVLRGDEGQARVSKEQLAEAAAQLSWKKSRRFVWESALDFADPRSESVGESVSRVRIGQLGFAAPALQYELAVDGKTYRLDFCWEDAGIVGEFDGWMKYRENGAEVLRQEKIREDGIRSTGRTMVRWYWEDLQNPERLRRKLLRAGVPQCFA